MVKERVVLGIGYSKYNFMCVVSVMVKVKYVLFKNKIYLKCGGDV